MLTLTPKPRLAQPFSVAMALGFLFVLAGAVSTASATPQVISSSGPLTNIYLSNDLACQVEHTGTPTYEFYQPASTHGDCGTFIWAGGSTSATNVYGPQGAADPYVRLAYTPVSQTAVTGSGTSADPYKVVTVVDVGSTGLSINQTDSYVTGTEFYQSEINVKNSTSSAITASLYHAGDCYLQGTDSGYGFYDSSGGGIYCSEKPNNSPPGLIEGFVPQNGGSRYFESYYASVWGAITGLQFPNTCDCNTFEDNGAGLSWSITVPGNGSVTQSVLTVFSLTGTTPTLPYWYSNGTLINQGVVEPVTTSGTLTFHGTLEATCKVSDEETITNPVGGAPGTGELKHLTFSGCFGQEVVCPSRTKMSISAENLPWPIHLIHGPPARGVIEGVALEIKCANGHLRHYVGTLEPVIGNSVAEFDAGSGELHMGVDHTNVTGTDDLDGPIGDERITAEPPLEKTTIRHLEVGRCQAKADGKWRDANCSEKPGAAESEEAFEFVKGAEKVGFTSAGGEANLESESGTKIACATQSATGKYDQDSGVIKEVESVVATFKECGIPALGVKCNSAGAAEGEIKTFALKGPLGYISGEKTTEPVVGQELTPEKAKGHFAEFECTSPVKVVVKGKEGAVEGKTGGNCVIAQEEPPNKMSLTFTSHLKGVEGKPSFQEPQHFQPATAKYCNLEDAFNGGVFERSAEWLTTTVTNEETLEITA